MEAEEHMTETSLQITQLMPSRIDWEHTEMHWEVGAQGPGHSSFSMGIENSITAPWSSTSSPKNNHATSLESEWQEPT